MEKFYGKVGYAETVEVRPNVWKDQITERNYYGDVLKNHSKWATSEYLNDDLRISNRISVLADAYAFQNFSRIKYVEWMGVLWKVTDIEVERPRLVLTLGGEYNGSQP